MSRSQTIIQTLLVCGALTTAPTESCGQVQCVVADMETHTPIRNVKIFTNRGDVYVTDYTGNVRIDKAFESAKVSHVSYLERQAKRETMKDTLYLLPKENELHTLYVWGKDRKRIKELVGSVTMGLDAYAPPQGIATFDFFKMFEKKPLNKKTRKKNEELLKQWDEVYGKADEDSVTTVR